MRIALSLIQHISFDWADHVESTSELTSTSATRTVSQTAAVASCRLQELSEQLEGKFYKNSCEMFSVGENKTQAAEDVLDSSSKTMSIKERYLNFTLLKWSLNTVIRVMIIKRSFKPFSKKAKHCLLGSIRCQKLTAETCS